MRIFISIVITVALYSCLGNSGTKQIDTTNNTRKILLVSKPDSIITRISEIASDIKYIPMDCGPTCLQMVAKHYGKTYTLQRRTQLL